MIDITGERFGRLVAVSWFRSEKTDLIIWRLHCDCGGATAAQVGALRAGKARCIHCAGVPKHGKWHHRMHRVWASMKQRCLIETHVAYARYGGRGITVCNEWLEFIPFMKWADANGYDDSLELDRIDNDGGYSPGNCRFVTRLVNANNRSTCTHYDFCGETMTISQASRRFARSQSGIKARIARGMSPSESVTLPWQR